MGVLLNLQGLSEGCVSAMTRFPDLPICLNEIIFGNLLHLKVLTDIAGLGLLEEFSQGIKAMAELLASATVAILVLCHIFVIGVETKSQRPAKTGKPVAEGVRLFDVPINPKPKALTNSNT